jgi:hypothetical protein
MCGVPKDVVRRASNILNSHKQADVPAATVSLALQQRAAHWADELNQLDSLGAGEDGQQAPDAAAAISFLMSVANQANQSVKTA